MSTPASTIVGEPLSGERLESLCRESAILPEVVAERGYTWVETPADLGYAGFPTYQRSTGLLIPLWSVDKEIKGSALRPEIPRPGTKRKYEIPQGQSMFLDVPPRCHAALKDPARRIIGTEGAKKADSIASKGECGVNFNGVYGWRHTNPQGGKIEIPDLEAIALNGRDFLLVFDSDWRQNRNVREALRRLGARLSQRGAKVLYVDLPSPDGRKVGIDDFFAAGGTINQLYEHSSSDAPKPFDFHLGDLGNAERLLTNHGADMRYVASAGWHVWDGARWRTGKEGDISAVRFASKIVDSVLAEAMLEKDKERKEHLTKLALSLQLKGKIDAMVSMAATMTEVEATIDQFDANPHLLGCTNGTIDLRTGELIPASAADMITMCTGCAYEETACPLFLQFLSEICMGREDLMRFLVVSLGYILSGDTSTHAFWFLTGIGRNGKSLLTKIMQKIMGTYATVMMPESIMVRKFEQIPADLAKLHKKRLVVVPEVSDNTQLNIGLIKALSGFDQITARFMRENFFEFWNTAKLWMVGNEKPHVQNFNTALMRRMKVVPFDFVITKEQEDEHLESKIWREAPGILWLIVQGYQEYLSTGLPEVEAVSRATEAYRREVDDVATFIEEECDLCDEVFRIKKKDLRNRYRSWCKTTGVPELQRNAFYEAIERHGVKDPGTRTEGDVVFSGIRVKGGSLEI